MSTNTPFRVAAKVVIGVFATAAVWAVVGMTVRVAEAQTVASATLTTITTSQYPALPNQQVTFTATVSSAGIPVSTGSVQFSVNGAPLQSPIPVSASGVAAISTTPLPVGYLIITASYTAASGAVQSGSSATLTQLVTSSPQYSNSVLFNNSVRTLGSGFHRPYATAVDPSGNVFVADSGNAAVKRILATGGFTTVTSVGSGFGCPTGLAIDATGNVFVADPCHDTVYELLAATGYASINDLDRGFASPYGVALDFSGNLNVADTGHGSVKRLPLCPSCSTGYGAATIVGSGLQYPWSLALDFNNDVFVTDIAQHTLNEIPGGTSTVNTLGSSFLINPYGVALDGPGNLFVTDAGAGTVREMSVIDGFTTVSTPAYGLNVPLGLASNGYGSANLFVADTDSNTVKQILQAGGDFGLVHTGASSPSPVSMVFWFHEPTTLGSAAVLTQGAGGDFTDAGSDTCAANTAYAANSTCTVNVNFTPSQPGAHTGSAELLDSSGNVLAVGTVQGTGIATTLLYQPVISLSTGTITPQFFAVGDFNGDGKPDLAVPDYGTQIVAVYLNQGGGTFSSPVISKLSLPTGLVQLFSGDFNEDGKADLVVSTNYGVFVLLNNGDGTFTQQPAIPGSFNFLSGTAADFNDDGHQDMFLGGNGMPYLFLGKGDGTFSPGTVGSGTHPGTYTGVTTGDFNGDKKLDAIAGDAGGGGVDFFAGDGTGNLANAISAHPPFVAPASIDAADLNHDGKLDLLIAGDGAVGILGNGDGTFQTQQDQLIPIYFQFGSNILDQVVVKASDLNQDGYADAVVLDGTLGLLWLALNDGTGAFPPETNTPYTFQLPAGSYSLATADFNGDGLPDIVVASPGAKTISILLSIKP